jgi:Domain of unknown function (DUF362)
VGTLRPGRQAICAHEGALGRVRLSGIPPNPAFYQCDVYASIAKLKNHGIAGVTMTMKNNFGNTHPARSMAGTADPAGTSSRRKSADQYCTTERRPPPRE